MASKMRVEFVRLRSRDSNGTQNILSLPDHAPVTKAVTGTALTGAGRVTVPANVAGYTSFHARITSDVELVVSVAPAGDAGTTYDASAAQTAGFSIPANTPTLIPVTAGQLISAATGLAFA
jgi:membrane protein required for beta-lactamase induction